MTGPAGRTSFVEDVEFGPSDHSSALQLLSLAGNSRSPIQEQPQPQQQHQPLQHDNGAMAQPQVSTPTIDLETTKRALETQIRHNSPITTSGRHRKKRFKLKAEAAMNAMNASEEDTVRESTSTSLTEAAMTLSDFGAAAAAADTTNESLSVPEPSSSSPEPPNVDANRNGINGSKQENRNGSSPTEQAEGSPLEEKQSRKPMPLKTLGHRKAGSRRHASLPMNRRKKHETIQSEQDEHSEPTEKVKKKSRSKSVPSKSIPTAPAKKEYVDNPTDQDILLGMRKFNSHPGNEVYRETVRKFQPLSKTKERTEVARDIINHIYNVIGGRFLKVDGRNGWEVMPLVDVMTKVGKAIVELRKKPGPSDKKASKMETSVLDSLNDLETLTSTRRPKRKATLGRKVNDFTSDDTVPSSSFKKKKPKLPGTPKSTGPVDATPVHKIVQVERAYEEYTYKPDPNEFYVEETAHIYHNPPFPSEWTNGVTREELRPVPPPQPLPSFPNNDSCKWSFDEGARVLIADFSVNNTSGGQPLVTLEDSKFLFEMHERTDITVISRGLLNMSKIDPSMWSLEYLRKCVGREFYHKFRRFDKTVDENGIETYVEKDNLYSMRFEDYVEYCEKRGSYMDGVSTSLAATEEPTFAFEDHLGRTHSVGVGTSALYMIDVDIKRLTPILNRNFLESFELPAVLPGGSHCMMNSVTPDARPFMGPNLYVTPPASFTHFHQDGHGTVDSGHLCISGFNEVVMLRRLTERHKKHALWILSGKKPGGFHFDGLYSMPHGDGLGEKPSWPKTEWIDECRKMGYCPSVFTLEPGDLVHINKGRLHAFRKMSTTKLPEWDCHAELRRNVVESKGIAGEEKMCVSVAWDWMYRGVTPAGINREISTVLEGSTLNRRNEVTSLAIPELSLLQMAKSVPARSLNTTRRISFLDALEKKEKKASIYESTKEDICKGIFPGLCIVIGQHIRALNVKESKSTEKGVRLSIAKIPDTQENPQTCPLDPYGDSDFQCKLCRKELSNVYFHCDGCEKLLSKDFNICRGCYLQGKFMMKVQMHPSNPKRHATLNHMGDNRFDRQSRCPCKNGPACNYCGYCLGCSCRCHTWFTMRTRLCNAEDEEKLLQKVQDVATVEDPSKSTLSEGVHVAGVFEVDESTKHLRDRLKYAGDDELLNEDVTEVKDDDDPKLQDEGDKDQLPNEVKKEDTEVKDDEKLLNEDKKGQLLSEVKKEDVEVEHDDEKLPSDDTKGEEIKKNNSTANENNGHGSLVRDFKGIGDDEEILI